MIWERKQPINWCCNCNNKLVFISLSCIKDINNLFVKNPPVWRSKKKKNFLATSKSIIFWKTPIFHFFNNSTAQIFSAVSYFFLASTRNLNVSTNSKAIIELIENCFRKFTHHTWLPKRKCESIFFNEISYQHVR